MTTSGYMTDDNGTIIPQGFLFRLFFRFLSRFRFSSSMTKTNDSACADNLYMTVLCFNHILSN